MTKKNITAGELMERLNADPAFVERRARQDQQLREREAEYRRAEAPLVDELRAAGYPVRSAWNLINTGSYPDAVPILLAHVVRPYPPAVREGIARALGVPETKRIAWKVLIGLYVDEPDDHVKSGLAAAINAAADREVIDDVIALARDTRLGSSRLLLLSALTRSKQPQSRAALVELASDPDLTKEIEVILRRSKRAKH